MPTSFQKKVYEKCSQVPKGKVTTYKALAQALNSSPRAVGQALRCNPYAPIVPCHRVVSANGSIGGFMGEIKGKAIQKKIALLKNEGVRVINGSIAEFENKMLNF